MQSAEAKGTNENVDMKKLRDGVILAPTDLANYLSCRHLTGMDLRAAKAGTKRRGAPTAPSASPSIPESYPQAGAGPM